MRYLKIVLGLFLETFSVWRKDKASGLAAALAYYAVFALAPLLIVIIVVVGAVFGERAIRNEIAYQIDVFVGFETARFIENLISNLTKSEVGVWASIIGGFALLFAASGLLVNLQGTLNTVWRVPPSKERFIPRIIKQRLFSFLVIIGLGGIILAYQSLYVVFDALINYFGDSSSVSFYNAIFSFGMLILLFALVFRVLPDIDIPWRDVWLGAVVTTILFTVGRNLIVVYLSSRNIGSVYGAAGSIIVLLLWIYYSAQIFLFGAEFTYVFACRYGSYAGNPVDFSDGMDSNGKLSTDYRVIVDHNPLAGDVQHVEKQLEVFNHKHTPPDCCLPLTVFLWDGEGKLKGGLLGETHWGWLQIRVFWIDEPARGRGYGTLMLQAAEKEAQDRGCGNVHLDTLGFQGVGFYEKYGYEVFGVLDGFVAGQKRYYMKKNLALQES